MLATQVACPNCGKPLRLAAPLPAGKRLGCPACGASFTTGGPAAEAPAPAAGDWWVGAGPAAPAPPPTPAPSGATPAFQAQPPALPARPAPWPPPEPEAPARTGNAPLILGLLFGGFLLLGGSALLLAVTLGRKKEETRTADAEPADKEKPKENSREKPANPPRDPGTAPPPGSRPVVVDRSDGPPRRDGDPDPPRPVDIQRPIDTPTPEPPPRLPREQQEKVNRAIEEGVAYLKRTQQDSGSWTALRQHDVGFAALPGLTLLECGVPPDDPQVKKAAAFVRRKVPELTGTYELSLAILFLDRLGDPADERLIRTMALRLIAGQTPTGGWTYTCPLLSGNDEMKFLTALALNRPRDAADLMLPGLDGKEPLRPVIGPNDPDRNGNTGKQPDPNREPTGVAPFRPGEKLPDPDPAAARRMVGELPPALRRTPALQPPEESSKMPANDASDNSNTQFAILAIWASGRHGVPTERTLALLTRRFRTSQGSDGSWGYHYFPKDGGQRSAAMTGAGLLGLAVGHGLTADEKERKNVKDPMIEKGLARLGQSVGKPLGGKGGKAGNRGGEVNLYFMWTLERVGMLYNLNTVGDRDWYAWGAEELVERQKPDGSWLVGGYYGSTATTDTSFALLFLKRANLAKDLTKKLEFVIEAKDPGSGK
jgi:hypothetical protein